jgi:hypothetical protein
MKNLKVFVWDSFAMDYSPGLAVAIAETEEEAKALVLAEFTDPYTVSEDIWGGPPNIYPLGKCAFQAFGGG